MRPQVRRTKKAIPSRGEEREFKHKRQKFRFNSYILKCGCTRKHGGRWNMWEALPSEGGQKDLHRKRGGGVFRKHS